MRKRSSKPVVNQARQGDVFIIRRTHVAGAVKKPVDKRGVVLAEGEVTGHHHRITDPGVCSLRAEGVAWDLLQIGDGIVGKLVHEEHDSFGISAGTFEVRIQREHSWNAEAEEVSRAVAD
jgi:hypothetical protein